MNILMLLIAIIPVIGFITFYQRIKKILLREGYEVSAVFSMNDIHKMKHLISKTPKEKKTAYKSLMIGIFIHLSLFVILLFFAFS